MSEDMDDRAGEYVLGVQEAGERAAFERELALDPDLRAAVAAWERRLQPLAASARPVAAPSDMLRRIKSQLPLGPSAEVIALRRAAGRWRLAALAAGALAASLAAISFAPLWQAGRGEYVAAVNRAGEAPALIVRVDPGSRRVQVRRVAAEAPAGKSLELWYVGPGAAPRSLGLIDAAEKSVALPEGAGLENVKFAVSVEPQGGSRTGAATGPVVYIGDLIRQ